MASARVVRAAIFAVGLLLVLAAAIALERDVLDHPGDDEEPATSPLEASRCDKIALEQSGQRSGALSVSPQVASPGQHFTVSFPNRRSRSQSLMMTATSGGCDEMYVIDGPNSWTELSGAGTFAALSVVTSTRTLPGVVPETASPGTYAVCNDANTTCARLTVRP
jgi:hypothetical protein